MDRSVMAIVYCSKNKECFSTIGNVEVFVDT